MTGTPSLFCWYLPFIRTCWWWWHHIVYVIIVMYCWPKAEAISYVVPSIVERLDGWLSLDPWPHFYLTRFIMTFCIDMCDQYMCTLVYLSTNLSRSDHVTHVISKPIWHHKLVIGDTDSLHRFKDRWVAFCYVSLIIGVAVGGSYHLS